MITEQMKVKDLIETLSKLDPDMPCEVEGEPEASDGYADILNINIHLIRRIYTEW